MIHKEIEQYRKELTEIINKPKQADGNPAEGTKKDLQELAKKVGANTRAVYTGPNGGQLGYDAGISDLTDSIHTALQTATMIDTCKVANRTFWIVGIAAVASAIAAWVAILIAQGSCFKN